MKEIYIYSNNEFLIIHNEKTFKIGYMTYLKLTEFEQSDCIFIQDELNNFKELKLNNLKNQSGIKIYALNDKTFINILYLQPESLTQTINLENIEVNFHHTYVTILNNSIYYTYNFDCEKENFCLSNEDKIFIFNENSFLEFDKANSSFFVKNVVKFKREENIIEVLTNLPFVENHYTLFSFNLDKNTYSQKNLKAGNLKLNDFTLAFATFYLLKNNLQSQMHFYKCGNVDKLKKYVNNYNELKFFEDCYYMFANDTVTQIKFKIENNEIVDID